MEISARMVIQKLTESLNESVIQLLDCIKDDNGNDYLIDEILMDINFKIRDIEMMKGRL
jgi:hypothetical protein